MTLLAGKERRIRSLVAEGKHSILNGEFRASFTAAALTTIAAGTGTAGHIFAARWSSTTGKKAVIRFLKVDFLLTVAFGAAQNMGFDLLMARAYTASDTGGTAIDMGSTITGSGKLRTAQDASLFAANAVRIGGAGALTSGTHTVDASPLYSAPQVWMGAVGTALSWTAFDARDDGTSTNRSPIELAQDEGFKIRNTVLMGATGVGTAIITMEWDEVTL